MNDLERGKEEFQSALECLSDDTRKKLRKIGPQNISIKRVGDDYTIIFDDGGKTSHQDVVGEPDLCLALPIAIQREFNRICSDDGPQALSMLASAKTVKEQMLEPKTFCPFINGVCVGQKCMLMEKFGKCKLESLGG